MIQQDFFVTEESDPWGGGDIRAVRKPYFNVPLVSRLRVGPLDGRTDLEAAIALAALVHDELLAFGTAGGESLNDSEMGAALIALRSVCKRIGVKFEPPYRNFSTFKSYWLRNDGYNSWQARRDMLEELFEPLHLELVRLEERTFDALADPVTPHADLGWPLVDEEITELRRRFQAASTPQDYRALGTNIVGVLEALGQVVYEPGRHLRDGEVVPAIDKTKQRIGRYIEDALPGPRNADIRALVGKASDLAHHIKHSPTATRRDAGIAADAVILLANMVKRLDQQI